MFIEQKNIQNNGEKRSGYPEHKIGTDPRIKEPMPSNESRPKETVKK